jgi:hypothetical protein
VAAAVEQAQTHQRRVLVVVAVAEMPDMVVVLKAPTNMAAEAEVAAVLLVMAVEAVMVLL